MNEENHIRSYVIRTFHLILIGWLNQDNEMGRECSAYDELELKPKGKEQLGNLGVEETEF